jgi:hypothetical protein
VDATAACYRPFESRTGCDREGGCAANPGFRVARPVASVPVIDVIGDSMCVADIRQGIAAYLSVVGARFRTSVDIAFQGVSGQALLEVSPPGPRATAASAPGWSRKGGWRMEMTDHA